MCSWRNSRIQFYCGFLVPSLPPCRQFLGLFCCIAGPTWHVQVHWPLQHHCLLCSVDLDVISCAWALFSLDFEHIGSNRNCDRCCADPWTGLGDKVRGCMMDDVVDLGDTSQCPSSQPHFEGDTEFVTEFLEPDVADSPRQMSGRGGGRGRARTSSGRSASAPSQSQATTLHKVRGPNWTEEEMFVLIGRKRIEWDGRHNSNQPSLAKFVYGTMAWKIVLAGCMNVVGFRARDVDQITNKWDGLIKDYKKLKEYIECTGSCNWWGMSREEKKDLSKSRKMPLEFSERMYIDMEGFVGKRQIFGRSSDVVDSDRVSQPAPSNFGRSPSTARVPAAGGVAALQLLPGPIPALRQPAHLGMTLQAQHVINEKPAEMTIWWSLLRSSIATTLLVWRHMTKTSVRGGASCLHWTLHARHELHIRRPRLYTWMKNFIAWKWRGPKI